MFFKVVFFMRYTYSHLEDFIQIIYSKLNTHSPTEMNIYAIADALNIGLYHIGTCSQAIHFEGRHYIFLDVRLTAPERFEMFGHELGHIFLHTGNQQQMLDDYRMYQEWKANLFALHFCIPTFMLQTLPDHTLNKYQISELFGVTIEFADKRLNRYHEKHLLHNSMQQFEKR